ncbi:MAG TPA: UdgX family uracil-DNA binding protein [Roseomonas sp.]|jgi:DNA polymerase
MHSLDALRAAIIADDGLPDWAARATGPVFGEGPPDAALMLVGEQPGDEEDRGGRPFIGPAGRLLDGLLNKAGVPRRQTYVTNAVKHFKFTQAGKRRLHQSPNAGDIAHYRPFLRAEVALVAPRLVVALGATALRALTGKALTLTRVGDRTLHTEDGVPLRATMHPSALLRMRDPAVRMAQERRCVAALRSAYAEAAGG